MLSNIYLFRYDGGEGFICSRNPSRLDSPERHRYNIIAFDDDAGSYCATWFIRHDRIVKLDEVFQSLSEKEIAEINRSANLIEEGFAPDFDYNEDWIVAARKKWRW